MGRLRVWFWFSLLACSMGASAFVYDLCVLRRWSGNLGTYQYFIGLGDFHDKAHQANRTQQKDLSAILANVSPDVLRVGLENISSLPADRASSCGRFSVFSRGSILGGFTRRCNELGHDVRNFEYRYCRVASLGPVLNNLHSDMRQFPSVVSIRVSELIKEIEDVLSELLSYKGDQLVRNLYAHCVRKVKSEMRALKLYKYADSSIADYLGEMTTRQTRLAFLKRLLTFDSVLFDMRMFNHAINSEDKQSYLAFAGGSHIKRVAALLARRGYEWVHKTEPSFNREYNMRKCLGGHVIEGSYCRRPRPVDVSEISNFL